MTHHFFFVPCRQTFSLQSFDFRLLTFDFRLISCEQHLVLLIEHVYAHAHSLAGIRIYALAVIARHVLTAPHFALLVRPLSVAPLERIYPHLTVVLAPRANLFRLRIMIRLRGVCLFGMQAYGIQYR